MCIQSLLHDNARQKSIDLIAREPGQEGSTVTKDWRSFFGRVTGSRELEIEYRSKSNDLE